MENFPRTGTRKAGAFIARYTAQKMKFSIKDFFSKCDQIRRKLRIWSHLLKKSLTENFISCAVIGCKQRSLICITTINLLLRDLLDEKKKKWLLVNSARAVPYAKVYLHFFNQCCEEVCEFFFCCFYDVVFSISVVGLILGYCCC